MRLYSVELINDQGCAYDESEDFITLEQAKAWARQRTEGERNIKVRIVRIKEGYSFGAGHRIYYATNGRLTLDKSTSANTF